jgi:pimeloyl-ACP methyl ester carboxylesterase
VCKGKEVEVPDTSTPETERLLPPSKLLLLAELRALFELATGLSLVPVLLTAPHGDGHPVLVLPGLLASDASTKFLRQYLKWLGYDACGWELGTNINGFYGMREMVRQRLADIHSKSAEKVSLIGWSLGGIFARDLAVKMPEAVRQVITLGSPFTGDIHASNARRIYEMTSGEPVEMAREEDLKAIGDDMPVPTTSIYTRTDGIVNWKTCLVKHSDTAENIEVLGASHSGLGVNAAVLWAVADRLRQHSGDFSPFDATGPFALAYGHRPANS